MTGNRSNRTKVPRAHRWILDELDDIQRADDAALAEAQKLNESDAERDRLACAKRTGWKVLLSNRFRTVWNALQSKGSGLMTGNRSNRTKVPRAHRWILDELDDIQRADDAALAEAQKLNEEEKKSDQPAKKAKRRPRQSPPLRSLEDALEQLHAAQHQPPPTRPRRPRS